MTAYRPVTATIYENRKAVEVTGTVHGWATDHEMYEDGCGPIPVAIIELDNGYVVTACASKVRFLDRAAA